MENQKLENSSLSFNETISSLAVLTDNLGTHFSKNELFNSSLINNHTQLLKSAQFYTLIQPDWSVPGEERYQMTNDALRAVSLLKNNDNPVKAMKFIALDKISLFLPKSVSEMDEIEKQVLSQNIQQLQFLLK